MQLLYHIQNIRKQSWIATRSLIYVGKASFLLCIMHLISYYEMFLSSKSYIMLIHMPYFYFVFHIRHFLSALATKLLGKFVICTNNSNFNLITTPIIEHSLTGFQLKSIYSYFSQFMIHPLCDIITSEEHESQLKQEWTSPILTFLMQVNWGQQMMTPRINQELTHVRNLTSKDLLQVCQTNYQTNNATFPPPMYFNNLNSQIWYFPFPSNQQIQISPLIFKKTKPEQLCQMSTMAAQQPWQIPPPQCNQESTMNLWQPPQTLLQEPQ